MTSSQTAKFREYPKWVGGKIVRNAAEEREVLGVSAEPEPAISQEEFDAATEDAEADLMESLDAPPRDPLDLDGDGRKGGSKRGRKLHRQPKG